jgi:hypothetical protein
MRFQYTFWRDQDNKITQAFFFSPEKERYTNIKVEHFLFLSIQMIKLMKDIFSLSFFIIFFYQNIDQINTLRCAHECSIGPTPFGSLDPIKNPCDTVNINITTTICSVFLVVNFETEHIQGALNEKKRSVNQSSILHLELSFESDETMTYITYQCSTTDNCDEEFVRETISSPKWFQLNEPKVRADITALMFETEFITDRLICDDNLVCLRDEQCVAELTENNSVSQINQIYFNNKFPCNTISDSQVRFDRHFHAPGAYQDMIMKVNCNKNKCNQRKIVEQVFNIIRNDFVLPLNYSAYIYNGSCRRDNFINITIFLFLYILCFFSIL